MADIFKIIVVTFTGFFLVNPITVFAQNASQTTQTLYKWQDKSGKWYYSKVPPLSEENTTNKIETAKSSKTIIFKEQINIVEDKELIAQQKLKQKRAACKSSQSLMMDMALYLHKATDESFQDKEISREQYNQEKLFISNLEDISADLNFYNNCMDDFSTNTQQKAISNCMTNESDTQNRVSCLKKLSSI